MHIFTKKRTPRPMIFPVNIAQSCQNVPAAGNFVAFSQLLAAYFTLDMEPTSRQGDLHLLPTTPAMLPAVTKHFDRADSPVCQESNGLNILPPPTNICMSIIKAP